MARLEHVTVEELHHGGGGTRTPVRPWEGWADGRGGLARQPSQQYSRAQPAKAIVGAEVFLGWCPEPFKIMFVTGPEWTVFRLGTCFQVNTSP